MTSSERLATERETVIKLPFDTRKLSPFIIKMEIETIEKQGKFNKEILKRIAWFKELEEKCKEEIEDLEAARIVFRRLCYEEK